MLQSMPMHSSLFSNFSRIVQQWSFRSSFSVITHQPGGGKRGRFTVQPGGIDMNGRPVHPNTVWVSHPHSNKIYLVVEFRVSHSLVS